MKRKAKAIGLFGLCLGCFLAGLLAGYIWGGWNEWEKGYHFAVKKILSGDAVTVQTKIEALEIAGAGDEGFREVKEGR